MKSRPERSRPIPVDPIDPCLTFDTFCEEMDSKPEEYLPTAKGVLGARHSIEEEIKERPEMLGDLYFHRIAYHVYRKTGKKFRAEAVTETIEDAKKQNRKKAEINVKYNLFPGELLGNTESSYEGNAFLKESGARVEQNRRAEVAGLVIDPEIVRRDEMMRGVFKRELASEEQADERLEQEQEQAQETELETQKAVGNQQLRKRQIKWETFWEQTQADVEEKKRKKEEEKRLAELELATPEQQNGLGEQRIPPVWMPRSGRITRSMQRSQEEPPQQPEEHAEIHEKQSNAEEEKRKQEEQERLIMEKSKTVEEEKIRKQNEKREKEEQAKMEREKKLEEKRLREEQKRQAKEAERKRKAEMEEKKRLAAELALAEEQQRKLAEQQKQVEEEKRLREEQERQAKLKEEKRIAELEEQRRKLAEELQKRSNAELEQKRITTEMERKIAELEKAIREKPEQPVETTAASSSNAPEILEQQPEHQPHVNQLIETPTTSANAPEVTRRLHDRRQPNQPEQFVNLPTDEPTTSAAVPNVVERHEKHQKLYSSSSKRQSPVDVIDLGDSDDDLVLMPTSSTSKITQNAERRGRKRPRPPRIVRQEVIPFTDLASNVIKSLPKVTAAKMMKELTDVVYKFDIAQKEKDAAEKNKP